MISVREKMMTFFNDVNVVPRIAGLVEQVVFNPMNEQVTHTKTLTVRVLRERMSPGSARSVSADRSS
jgi:hypothetical protein